MFVNIKTECVMKKFLVVAASILISAVAWAQSYTGDAARDAKINAEKSKIADGGSLIIDEQTAISIDEDYFNIDTEGYWPENQLTAKLPRPEFGEKVGTTISLDIADNGFSNIIILISKSQFEDVEKYIEKMKSDGWNKDVYSKWSENVYEFEAVGSEGQKCRLTYNKMSGQTTIDIDN